MGVYVVSAGRPEDPLCQIDQPLTHVGDGLALDVVELGRLPRRLSVQQSKSVRFSLSLVTTAIAGGVLCACAWRADAATYFQTNLVSDIDGLAAVTDPSLKNPWGLVGSVAGSPFWTSNQGTNSSTLYNVVGTTNVSKVPPSANTLYFTDGISREKLTGFLAQLRPHFPQHCLSSPAVSLHWGCLAGAGSGRTQPPDQNTSNCRAGSPAPEPIGR